MKKEIIFLFGVLFLISFVQSATVTNTTFTTTFTNYTIYVNGSITLDKVDVTNNSIELYNFSTEGQFDNTNDTFNSVVSFFGLSSPNNDLRWDNGTEIGSAVEDLNVTVAPSRFIELGDFTFATTTTTTTDTGGSSGGGGGGVVVKKDFDLDSEFYDKNMVLNRIEFGEFTIENTGDAEAEFVISVGTLEGLIILDETKVKISSKEKRKIGFKILSPEEAGVYTGKIVVQSGNIKKELLTTLNVKSEKSLFDILVTIPNSMRTISIGENLKAQIDLTEMGLKDYKDVTLMYEIKDFDGNVQLVESETVAVADQKVLTKEFQTESLVPGEYILAVELIYPDGVAVASSHFKVKEKFGVDKDNLLIGLSIFIVILVLIIMIFAIKKYKRMVKHIK